MLVMVCCSHKLSFILLLLLLLPPTPRVPHPSSHRHLCASVGLDPILVSYPAQYTRSNDQTWTGLDFRPDLYWAGDETWTDLDFRPDLYRFVLEPAGYELSI